MSLGDELERTIDRMINDYESSIEELKSFDTDYMRGYIKGKKHFLSRMVDFMYQEQEVRYYDASVKLHEMLNGSRL